MGSSSNSDNKLILEKLGWAPEVSFDELVRTMMAEDLKEADRDRLCDIAERYLQKGSKVYLEGQLQTRKWQDQSGQDRYTTEVVLRRFSGVLTMLDSRGGGAGFSEGGDSFQQDQPMPAGPADDLDDEIPF